MTITNYAILNDNQSQLERTNANYATAHDDTTGNVSKLPTSYIGQYYTDTYRIYRFAFGFDTSDIPSAALIKSAYLTFYTATTMTATIDVIIKNGKPTYPTIPTPVDVDYKIANYSGNGGIGTVPIASATSFRVNFNDTGIYWINKSGISKFLLISENDNNSESPTGYEYSQLYTYYSPNPSLNMKLTVEYYLPTGIPAITSEGPCTDIQSTTMTAVGNVTDNGGGYVERGFEYYEDSDEYNEEMYAVRELGVFIGTGNFEMTIYGLKPETTYQIRAWVRNSYETAYGDWYTCTTKAVPGYSIYEEVNTATICFYLSEDDGKTWGQKHGPYTTDQADIEVTKLLVRGSGKKKIKFTSDVLTGISASVLVKLDCKAR